MYRIPEPYDNIIIVVSVRDREICALQYRRKARVKYYNNCV